MYNAWIRPPPKCSRTDESYNDPSKVLIYEYEEDDNGDHDFDDGRSDRTRLGRGDGWVLRTRSLVAAERDDGNGGDEGIRTNRLKSGPRGPRTQKGQNASAPAAVKRRKVLPKSSTHNRQVFSKASLSSFNQQCGKAVWTGSRIRHWSKTISKKKLLSP